MPAIKEKILAVPDQILPRTLFSTQPLTPFGRLTSGLFIAETGEAEFFQAEIGVAEVEVDRA